MGSIPTCFRREPGSLWVDNNVLALDILLSNNNAATIRLKTINNDFFSFSF